MDSEEEFTHFFKHNQIGYVYDAQEVTEFNLTKYLYRLEKNEDYDYLAKEKERKAKKDAKDANREGKEDKAVPESEKTELIELNESFAENNPNEILPGFEKMGVKIYLMTGKIESHLKKKKFTGLFDFMVLGLSSKNIFKEAPIVGKKNSKLLIELNSYMTTFDEKQKTQYKEKLKQVAMEAGYILEDTNSKYMWKFIYKNDTDNKQEDNNTNNANIVNIDKIELNKENN